jgi:hypothetical protein
MTFIGQAVGWYRLDQGAGLIGATLGAIIVLFIWDRLVVRHVLRDPLVPNAVRYQTALCSLLVA